MVSAGLFGMEASIDAMHSKITRQVSQNVRQEPAGFEQWTNYVRVAADRRTVAVESPGGIPCAAVGASVGTPDVHVWKFAIPSANTAGIGSVSVPHLVVGVADGDPKFDMGAGKPSAGSAWGLYLPSQRTVQTSDACRTGRVATFSLVGAKRRPDGEGDYVEKGPSQIEEVAVIADLGRRTLAFSVNGRDMVIADDITLPGCVRPWVWLYCGG